jgi:1-aminocyclopropane-1-carboxylate deaminase
MKLHFVSREEYRKKDTPEFIGSLQKQFGDFYLLPERGTHELAVKGCAEILSLIDIPFDYVCCPVGTGETLAGIVSSLKEKQQAIGFPVLKTSKVFKTFEVFSGSWSLNLDYHFGGYAKHTPELLKFIFDFEKQNNIPLDQVYTGKMMFGIYDLIKTWHFMRNETIVAIHTGGLQGKLH